MYGAQRGRNVLNKRPVVLLAACVAAGIVLGRYIHLTILYSTAAVVLTAAAVCFWAFKKRESHVGAYQCKVMYFGCAAVLLLGAALSSAVFSVDYVRTEKEQTVSGYVYNEPYTLKSGNEVLLIGNAHIDGQACGNIKLYVSEGADVTCGDVIFAVADTQTPPGVRNPGGFDEKLYLLTQGVHYKAYAQTVTVIGSHASPDVLLANLRTGIGKTIDSLFESDIAPVVRGMLLGDKYGIDEQTYMAFRDSGMAHVLAVSGLHAGILIAAVYGLLRLLRLGRRALLIVSIAFIAAYACIAGLTPSIMRASIMAAVLLMAQHSGRQTDTLSALAVAFMAALVINPLDLFSVGFQLSFGAVFGILTLGWQINRAFAGRLPVYLSGAIAASVGATAGTLPVTAAAFNRVPLVGILANIIVVPLASLAIVLSFVTVAAGLLIGQAAQYLGYIAAAVIRLMLGLISGMGVLPFAAADVASPPWYAMLVWYAVLFVLSKYLLIKSKLKAFFCASVAVIVIAVMLFSRPPGMYLVFLDVGQGDAAFLRTAQGGAYFFDGGREQSADEVVSFVVRTGARPDAAFVSHTDSDHFTGLKALYDEGLLKKVYCSWQEQSAVAAAMPNAQVVPLGPGDTVLLDDVTKAVVLYPCSAVQADDLNEMALVVRVDYQDHSVLFTGDISGLKETELFCAHDNVDIYKAAHHGSKYSSYRLPLSALLPAYSVISVGNNSYGHPDGRALRNLHDYSGQVLTTQDDYAIEFYIHNGIKVHTYGGKNNGG